MLFIHRSAFLSVCEACKNHASIFLATGEKTPSFFCKEDGRIFAEALVENQEITKEECLVIKDQLKKSSLPETLTAEQKQEIFQKIFTALYSEIHNASRPDKMRQAHLN